MSRIKCIPPENLTYPPGEINITFGVINYYNTTKRIKIRVLKCKDPDGTDCEFLASTNILELEPGEHTLILTLRLNQPSYYGIVVYNVDDEKGECGFVIKVLSHFELLTYNISLAIPILVSTIFMIKIIKVGSEIYERV